MKRVDSSKIEQFIESNIKDYHEKILKKLLELKLKNVLKRKNPYLFRVKALDTSQELIKSIIDAHLSSQEEGIFGAFLEQLAIFICEETYGGRKSSTEGIDLEFEKGGVRYIVSIKSGPNWGNKSQIDKKKEYFRKAKRILGTNRSKVNVVAVNGVCYGKDDRPEKEEYVKLCGQQFWELVSGNVDLYIEIIEPLGRRSKQRNEIFQEEYAKVTNRFTYEFSDEYCRPSGEIDWEKLVTFNSGKKLRSSSR